MRVCVWLSVFLAHQQHVGPRRHFSAGTWPLRAMSASDSMSTLVERARAKDLQTVVSGVFDAMQEDAVSEICACCVPSRLKSCRAYTFFVATALCPSLGFFRKGKSRSLRHM